MWQEKHDWNVLAPSQKPPINHSLYTADVDDTIMIPWYLLSAQSRLSCIFSGFTIVTFHHVYAFKIIYRNRLLTHRHSWLTISFTVEGGIWNADNPCIVFFYVLNIMRNVHWPISFKLDDYTQTKTLFCCFHGLFCFQNSLYHYLILLPNALHTFDKIAPQIWTPSAGERRKNSQAFNSL